MKTMRMPLLVLLMLSLCGCPGHRITGYNAKLNVGNTSYDDGHNAFFTGGSIDVHVDVR